MSPAVDRETLAERAAAVGRHLDRVARHLPVDPADLQPQTTASDTVILHLWQAVQLVIDLAISACVQLGLASPPTYADAFRRLAEAKVIPTDLADRLARAAGFRNLVVHAYGRLDLERVHTAAVSGPDDLRAFLAALRDYSPH
ncbi:MAG: type VII toxin-antitoxin system HepT family RNase toxin [Egibacteraceae bacterium]